MTSLGIPDPTPFAAGITAEDLKPLLDQLASAEMEGRETGEAGQRKAADFIAAQFKAAGLPGVADRNGYFQKISLQNDTWKDIGLKVGEQEFKNRTDFYVFPAFNQDIPKLELKEVVFVGYGIEDRKYNDYGNTDVKGKAVVFYNGEPIDNSGKSLVTGSEFRSDWSLDWKKKVQVARKKGASMVFIVDADIAESLKSNRQLISTRGWKPATYMGDKQPDDFVNNMFISPAVAAAILGKKADKAEDAISALRSGKEFKPVKVKAKIEVRLDKETRTLEGSNVVGFIEGTDPVLKNEYVFVTAHYDHLGMSDSTVIYYGADDNASGTSGVIEIARAFADAKKKGVGPRRSVVCMLVSGEEKGLLGSKFYVDFPLFPLEHTVVDINIDMIGRVDNAHLDNPDYIYVIGADRISPILHEINETSNKYYTQLALDYKYNAPDDPNHYYERSDHYNFAERGIPVVFYFNGTHADYHKPTDTADKINFNAMAKRAQLAFYTAWDVANRTPRLTLNIPTGKIKKD
ncbi:MAG: M28 family peptidase [Lewinellaceae bacterium]|nr:M28 family peptidase [Lewinellaceae bacterium]